VEGLVKQELSFIFKGGTALMLHLNSAKRLSIDIDVIIPFKPQNLDLLLDQVVEEQHFIRKEFQSRNIRPGIDKAHYKFYYIPYYKTSGNEEYVLLDILFEKILYKKIIPISIQSTFIPEMGSPVSVQVPCLEDLTGDKLMGSSNHYHCFPNVVSSTPRF
jgi:predicted nucleotidyltransferase component of viral defense system